MSLKKLGWWAVIAFIAYYIFTRPGHAGNTFQSLLNVLKTAGSSLAIFLNNV